MLFGEMLVREGIFTVIQVETALRRGEQQKVRLGTALVELGYLDIDTLARALSSLHRVPAVLTKHVAHIDPKVLVLFPPKVANQRWVIPLGWTQTKPARLVVAMRDPSATPMDELVVAAGARIDVGVAPEILIRRCLARYYGGSRTDMKFIDVDPAKLRKPDSSEPPAPARAKREIILSVPPLPMPPMLEEVEPELEPEPEPEPPRMLTAPPSALVPVLGTDEAVEALRACTTSDEIGNILATWLQSAYGLGVVLVVKDGLGMAVGWRGYVSGVDNAAIETIAMPLGPASMLTSAYEGKTSFRGPPPEKGAAVHRRLWTTLGCRDPEEVLVIPILLKDRVVNILYSHVAEGGHLEETALEDAARVAAAASTAYARLLRKPKTAE